MVVGGNASTLGFVNSLKGEKISAHLVPVAATPLGVELGTSRKQVSIASSSLFEWIDRTFPAGDERAFVASMRDVELLARVEWEAPLPEVLDERSVINIEDLPDEIVAALAHPPVEVVQCATCRRLCVRDEFVWNERQLCAWDFHAQV
ncbi:MAG: hypothetical protein JO359_02485, partial [Candidatus Eremiobacteraeota bacterium]|nr:hypothetical protein [Candidatus Eremiobacteraeota bacterium]